MKKNHDFSDVTQRAFLPRLEARQGVGVDEQAADTGRVGTTEYTVKQRQNPQPRRVRSAKVNVSRIILRNKGEDLCLSNKIGS